MFLHFLRNILPSNISTMGRISHNVVLVIVMNSKGFFISITTLENISKLEKEKICKRHLVQKFDLIAKKNIKT